MKILPVGSRRMDVLITSLWGQTSPCGQCLSFIQPCEVGTTIHPHFTDEETRAQRDESLA